MFFINSPKDFLIMAVVPEKLERDLRDMDFSTFLSINWILLKSYLFKVFSYFLIWISWSSRPSSFGKNVYYLCSSISLPFIALRKRDLRTWPTDKRWDIDIYTHYSPLLFTLSIQIVIYILLLSKKSLNIQNWWLNN